MKMIFIGFIIAFLICSFYFVTDFTIYSLYQNIAQDIAPVLNKTLQIPGNVYTMFNAERYY